MIDQGGKSGQTYDACIVPALILQRDLQLNVETCTLTTKLDAISLYNVFKIK